MSTDYHAIVLGAGPAGTGPLVCAMREGRAAALLERGVLWVDPQPIMAAGSLGQNAILSDTAASVFLECLGGVADNPLRRLTDSPEAAQLREFGSGPVPLAIGAAFLAAAGEVLRQQIAAQPRSRFIGQASASHVVQHGDGSKQVVLSDGRAFTCRHILFAMGGQQRRDWVLNTELAHGVALREQYVDRIRLTGDIVAHGGVERLQRYLLSRTGGRRSPSVAILGSSHSAMTVAHLLLHAMPEITWRPGAITLAFNRPPKLFYPSAQAAREDGYTDFNNDDICPLTGRVYRLAGLRMTSRALLRQVLGLPGTEPEPRLAMQPLPGLGAAGIEHLLGHSDLIVPAFGYRPRIVPLLDGRGARLLLACDVKSRAALVDAQCRVLDAHGQPLAGLYGMGLASGFIPRGPTLGGEASFVGQTNGLWLYQNDLGAMLVGHFMDAGAAAT